MKKATRNILIISACFMGAGIPAAAAALRQGAGSASRSPGTVSAPPLPGLSLTGWRKPGWMTFPASRSTSDPKRILSLVPSDDEYCYLEYTLKGKGAEPEWNIYRQHLYLNTERRHRHRFLSYRL